MIIDDALLQIARQNGLVRIDVGVSLNSDDDGYICSCDVWGQGIGNHSFAGVTRATIGEAVSAAINAAAERRAIAVPVLEMEQAA